MIRFLSRGLLLALAALSLASCGGGGDNAISLPGVSAYTMTVQTVDAGTGAPTTQTTALAPMRIEARLVGPDGVTPVGGATVHFSTTVGELGGATAQTDGGGYAAVVLNAGSAGVAAGTVVVTFNDPASNVASASVAVLTAGDESAGTGGGTASNVLRMTLTARDGAGTAISATNPVTALNPGRLIATVTLDGIAVDLALVTFTPPPVASLSQESTATSAGAAEVSITPVSSGAGTVTATATYNGQTVSASTVIVTSVVATAPVVLKLGSITSSVFTNAVLTSSATGPIQAGSTITISADVVDAATNQPYTTPVPVSFTSDCASLATPTATIDATGTTIGGHTDITYRPNGCAGTDIVRASLTNGSATLTAQTTITIDVAAVGQIAFISATPKVIALEGTGGLGRLTRSEVVFRVLGDDGNPIGNQQVCFGLSTAVGGLTVNSSSRTDSAGDVIAVVQAGSVPTSVRVNAIVDSDNDANCATVPNPAKSAVSDVLVVSTGLPDQDSFSLSVETANPLGYNVDGTVVGVSVYAADHFHNPVPDGTAISFWAELGSIEPSCTTLNGSCSVNWRSQNPRNNADPRDPSVTGLGIHDRLGRATIMAYAVGEESFVDSNGNGRYDVGDSFGDLDEVVKDSNLNGIRDEPVRLGDLTIADGFKDEEFVDFDHSLSFDLKNNKYDGVLCAVADTATCSGDATVNVRDTQTLVMSSNGIYVYFLQPDADISAIDYDVSGAVLDPVNKTCAGRIYGITQPTSLDVPADAVYTQRVASASNPCQPGGESITQVDISGGAQPVRVLVTDINGNAPAFGTTITAATSDTKAGSIPGTSSYIMASDTEMFDATFTVKPPDTDPQNGQLLIKVLVPGRSEISRSINVKTVPGP